MALLELDQSAFTRANRLDMHALLESWLPGFKVPRREDYLVSTNNARVMTDLLDSIIGLPSFLLYHSARRGTGRRKMGTSELLRSYLRIGTVHSGRCSMLYGLEGEFIVITMIGRET